jgi:hypothetical protein
MNEPSICIPRVFNFVRKQDIIDVFEKLLGKGCIERVDIVSHRHHSQKVNYTVNDFNKVFVHFNEWPDNKKSQNIRQRLLEQKTIKLVYDEPWFWKCSASRLHKPIHNSTYYGS